MKIASLLPSASEIVCALGLRENLIGRSHECDYPQDIKELPILTRANIDGGTSNAIDQQISQLLQDNLSVYSINLERLQQLQPDVIITQSQCDLCAVSFDEVNNTLQGTELASSTQIINLYPKVYEDIFADIYKVATSLDANTNIGLNMINKAKKLSSNIRKRIQSVEEKTKAIANKKTIFCIEWIEPLMNAGNWIPSLVAKAGGLIPAPFDDQTGEHSHYVTWQSLVEADPEVIILMPCGFDIARDRQEMDLLRQRPQWSLLQAVKTNQVYLVDGNQYFNRPSPRICDGVEIVAEILYPDLFARKHDYADWQLWPQAS